MNEYGKSTQPLAISDDASKIIMLIFMSRFMLLHFQLEIEGHSWMDGA